MKQPKILVTGAAGKTGGALVAQLLAKGFPVRALVRTQDARSQRLERLGAETVVADLFDPERLLTAMRGAARAYYLPPFHPHMLQGAAAFAAAAREARLEAVVQMSQWIASPAHPSMMTRQTWLADRLFATIPGVAHTILKPGMFADNFLRVLDFASLLGFYPVLTGQSRSAPVSNEDIARAAAAVLADPAPHAGESYHLTGPALLSGEDMAASIERVVGHRVRPVRLPMWMFYKVVRLQGVDPFEILDGYRHYLQDHRRGAFEWGGGVTDTVQELTGQSAEDFETTARRYAALPFARQTAGNRLRALIDFLRVPLQRGYDPDQWIRARAYPAPLTPRLASEDARWRAEHGAETVAPALVSAAA